MRPGSSVFDSVHDKDENNEELYQCKVVGTTIASPKLVYAFKGFDIEGGKAALRLTSTLLAYPLDLILNRDRELVAANFAHPLLVVVVAAAFLFQDGSCSVVLDLYLIDY